MGELYIRTDGRTEGGRVVHTDGRTEGGRVVHTDGRTDGRTEAQKDRQTDMTKLRVAFRNFANALKN